MPWHDEPAGRRGFLEQSVPRRRSEAAVEKGRGRDPGPKDLQWVVHRIAAEHGAPPGPVDAQPQLAHRAPGQECESHPKG